MMDAVRLVSHHACHSQKNASTASAIRRSNTLLSVTGDFFYQLTSSTGTGESLVFTMQIFLNMFWKMIPMIQLIPDDNLLFLNLLEQVGIPVFVLAWA